MPLRSQNLYYRLHPNHDQCTSHHGQQHSQGCCPLCHQPSQHPWHQSQCLTHQSCHPCCSSRHCQHQFQHPHTSHASHGVLSSAPSTYASATSHTSSSTTTVFWSCLSPGQLGSNSQLCPSPHATVSNQLS